MLSCAPKMYDEIWVGGKCMYKLEPVVADGGELIIYAPHIHEISVTHGELIEEIGYHCRDYFLKQWDQFKKTRGARSRTPPMCAASARYENGVEKCRARVTLATRHPAEICEKINMGYRDPDSIDVETLRIAKRKACFSCARRARCFINCVNRRRGRAEDRVSEFVVMGVAGCGKTKCRPLSGGKVERNLL